MENLDCRQIIERIAECYDKSGYGYLWRDLEPFLEKIGPIYRSLIMRVVDEGFLKVRNENVSTCIRGSISQEDRRNLAIKLKRERDNLFEDIEMFDKLFNRSNSCGLSVNDSSTLPQST